MPLTTDSAKTESNSALAARHASLRRDRVRHESICRQNPGNFHAWWNLARIDLELGRPQQAVIAFDRALSCKPRHLEVLIGKILACIQLKRLDEALDTVERALAAAPKNSHVLLHKGQVLTLLGRHEQALAVYDRILALPGLPAPKRLYALSVRVALLTHLGRYEEALAAVDQGLALASNSTSFLLNRSTVLIRLRRYEEALAALARLASVKALDFGGLSNQAQALAALRRFDEAEAVLGELRERYPERLREHEFFMPTRLIPEDAVAIGYSPRRLYFSELLIALGECDWQCYEAALAEVERLTAEAQDHGRLPPVEPFQLFSLPSSPALRLAVARDRAEHIDQAMKPLRDQLQLAYPLRQPGERLRIGYVSADFRDHPTAHLMRKLFQVHDRDRFEIIGYSLHAGDDSRYWSDIAGACDRFTMLVELSNTEAAQRIAGDGVHILVDLQGYSRFARPEIFALRPAPVQVSYLGFPGTLGADYIPYIIADRVVLPETDLGYYTERPVYLPECYQVNDDSQPIAETGISRGDQGLPDDAFVYCCFNAAYKIEPEVFAVWMRILNQVPDSVLWLLAHNSRAADNLRRVAEQHGVDSQRLIFAGRLPKPEHLERHRLADLFLDTFVVNAHTTASDALWAGLPLLTLCDEAFPARVGASLLTAVGLSELITYNRLEYEALAVGLAQDRARLGDLRSRLGVNRSTQSLFATERFARHLEGAFEMMWASTEAGESARPLYVEPLDRRG